MSNALHGNCQMSACLSALAELRRVRVVRVCVRVFASNIRIYSDCLKLYVTPDTHRAQNVMSNVGSLHLVSSPTQPSIHRNKILII